MRYFLFLFIVLLPRLATGQCTSSQKKPAWADGYFVENTNSYIEMATATGTSEEEARNKAAQTIIVRRNLSSGQQANVQVQQSVFVVTGGGGLEVKARVLDEYREQCGHGEYRVSLLVQTAKNPTFELERVNVTDKYPFSPRVFIPGMAQFHKGSIVKGVFFILGEATLVGGAWLFELERAGRVKLAERYPDDENYNLEMNDANLAKNVRNGFIAGATLLYVWNVVDGISAIGKKHVRVLGFADAKVTPFITPNLVSGISLSLNF